MRRLLATTLALGALALPASVAAEAPSDLFKEVSADRTDRPLGANGKYNLLVEDEQIVLETERDVAGIEAAARARYGDSVLVRRVEDVGGPANCGSGSRNDCRPFAIGGMEESNNGCTTAFTVQPSARILSAGHCHNPFTGYPMEWYSDGAKGGDTLDVGVAGNVDAAISEVLTSWGSPYPLVYRPGSATNITVKGSETYSQTTIGEGVLWNGNGSEFPWSGSVTSKTFAPYWVPDSFNFIRVEGGSTCVYGGDSGAPIYRSTTGGAMAMGILSGGTTDTDCTSEWMTYGHIQYPLGKWGKTVRTG